MMIKLFTRYKNYLQYTWLTRGFTFVELLIYMGLLSIMLSVLTMLFSSILDTSLESRATSAVEQDSRYLLARLSYDIHRASSIVSPPLGSSSASLQLLIDGATYTYTASSDGELDLTTALGTDDLVGADASLSALQFTTIGNATGKPLVQVSFSLTSKVTRVEGAESRTYQTVIGTR